MNVVLDTNILVSALRSNQGASHRLLQLLTENQYTPNISVPLFAEYESVLKRPHLLPHLNRSDIDAFLNYFLYQSKIRKIFYLWRPYLKDPKDDLILELAVESHSCIITHNLKDFKGTETFGVEVISPQTFLQRLKEPL